jgi:hypothetical protein
MSPGGDFFWLTQDYTVNLGWTSRDFEGQNTGHNVVAANFGLVQDSNNNTAPGGTYSSAFMSCTSCHDPHGQVLGGTLGGQLPIEKSGSYGVGPTDPATAIVGNYRLLGDSQYTAPGGLNFGADAPIAATVGFGEADDAHVDYGSGWSEWCGNCHGNYLNDGTMHAAGNSQTLDDFAINYNQYVETGKFDGLTATSYLTLVPFERGETVRTALDPTRTDGPEGGDNVMCLTCHRAHASAFQNATRWDMETELIANSIPTTAQVPLMANNAVPYYGKTFGEFQRSLCNKCHVQD